MTIIEELRAKASRDNRELLDRAADKIEDLDRNLAAAYKRIEEMKKRFTAPETAAQIKMEDSSRGHHHLKILPKYYMDVERGIKSFEIRFNDRGFKVGDILYLEEYCGGEATGRMLMREVCYMIDDPAYCKEGYVVLGLKGV